MTPDAPAALMRDWNLSHPVHVTTTVLADIWRVRLAGGGDAALKVYHDGKNADEAAGLALLDAWSTEFSPSVIANARGAILMEWLPGPDLTTLPDDRATSVLAGLIPRLHAIDPTGNLTPLRERFAALLDAPEDETAPVALARQTALALFAEPRASAALHGDLHHANVCKAARGWCVFDPKGLWGERAYDVANLFCNPLGAACRFDPDRAVRMAERLAPFVRSTPARVVDWGIAHAGLSALWSGLDTPDGQERQRVLSVLSDVRSQRWPDADRRADRRGPRDRWKGGSGPA